jgi:protein-disulfide isomerase
MLQPGINKKDHIQGSFTAPVVLVEYGDYQCPHCGAAHPHVKKLIRHFGDRMAFIFRNFPLSESHEMAFPAALSAEAAAAHDKFWELHDALLARQPLLSEGTYGLERIIQSVHLDPEQIAKEWNNPDLIQRVNDDFEGGVLSGVNGTPSFFINGVKYNGMVEFSQMEKAIRDL